MLRTDKARVVLTRAQMWLCLMVSMSATLLYCVCVWHFVSFGIINGVLSIITGACIMELSMVLSRSFLGEDP